MTALDLDFANLWPTIPMHNQFADKGQKEGGGKIHKGFWMLGLVGMIWIGIMLRFLFG